jgi:hypothetical protein
MSSYDELVQLPISAAEMASGKSSGGNRPGSVRRPRPRHVRLEAAQVEAKYAVVVLVGVRLHLRIGSEQRHVSLDDCRELRSTRRAQVHEHVLVRGEHGSGRAQLGAHVRDGGLPGGAQGARTRPDVLDDRVRSAGDPQHTGDVQDDVLRGRPSAELARQTHRDAPRIEQIPWEPRDHLDRVRTADTDRARAQASGVRRVRVRTDDQRAGEGVVLEDYLMNDAGAGAPEPRAVLGRGGAKKAVHLPVLGDRGAQVRSRADARLDEMVAVHRRRHKDAFAPCLHELKQARLAENVLKNDAIGSERERALAGFQLLGSRVVQVPEENLLRECQRAPHTAANDVELRCQCFVHSGGHFRGRCDVIHGPSMALPTPKNSGIGYI